VRILKLLHPEGIEDGAIGNFSDTSVSLNSLFVVGDVRQSIYSFRGADPAIFQELYTRFQNAPQSADYDLISLTHNFRSRPEILALVAAVFDTDAKHALPARAEMTAGQDYAPAPMPCIDFLLSHDLARQQYAESEAAALAAHLRRLVDSKQITIAGSRDDASREPITWNDVMVLFRSLADIQPWVKAFEDAGIPVNATSADRHLLQSTAVCDLLDFMTAVLHPHDDIALLTVLRSPFAGISAHSVAKLLLCAGKKQGEIYSALLSCIHDKSLTPSDLTASQGILEALHQAQFDSAFISPVELFERVLRLTRYEQKLRALPEGAAEAENVRRFVQFLIAEDSEDYEIEVVVRKVRELQELELREVGDRRSEQNSGVRFLTIHAAKGLEAPVVALADLSRSLLARDADLFTSDLNAMKIGTRITGTPDATYASLLETHLERDSEEMKRLLYVALTRAREHLILCGNIGRNRGFNWADMIFSALGIGQNTPEGEIRLPNVTATLLRHGTPAP
jgi:ATP-dependent helicase/nuclease subunit A